MIKKQLLLIVAAAIWMLTFCMPVMAAPDEKSGMEAPAVTYEEPVTNEQNEVSPEENADEAFTQEPSEENDAETEMLEEEFGVNQPVEKPANNLLPEDPVPGEPDVSVEYIGELDPFTGLPYATAFEQGNGTRLIRVSTGVDYDERIGKFVHYVNQDATITINSTVTNDMVVTEPVSFEGEILAQATLYRNGRLVKDVDYGNIVTPGCYILSIKIGDLADAYRMNFTILSKRSSVLKGFSVPAGFVITEVSFNEEVIETNQSYLEMMQEGLYSVKYQCRSSKMIYQFIVEVDHTPPTLKLEAVVDGMAHGPVSLADLESGATMIVTLDGNEIKSEDTLVQSGSYSIVVIDEAGNNNTYNFVIGIYFNDSSLVFFFLIGIAIISITGYLWYQKKHLRIC